MATWDVWIHPHGRDAVCIDTVEGTKKREGKKAMRTKTHYTDADVKMYLEAIISDPDTDDADLIARITNIQISGEPWTPVTRSLMILDMVRAYDRRRRAGTMDVTQEGR